MLQIKVGDNPLVHEKRLFNILFLALAARHKGQFFLTKASFVEDHLLMLKIKYGNDPFIVVILRFFFLQLYRPL